MTDDEASDTQPPDGGGGGGTSGDEPPGSGSEREKQVPFLEELFQGGEEGDASRPRR